MTTLRILIWLLAASFFSPWLQAHHEAIFGPNSATLISRKRFVSTQYYSTSSGRDERSRGGSHIGVVSAGTDLGRNVSVSAAIPFEGERGGHEEPSSHDEAGSVGIQDVVLAFRYFPQLPGHQLLIGVLTLEPPTGNLEHRAVGFGGGILYGNESGHWSFITYSLGRTEKTLESGERRGNRLFLGGGLAYETASLPFSPQLGISWEQAAQRRSSGHNLPESKISALMLHPTLSKTFRDEALQAFLSVSVPVTQWSGEAGWQRFRIAAGVVWAF